MPETEEQRRARELREADQAARTMFNVFPQGALQSLGQTLQNVFSTPQSGTMAGVSVPPTGISSSQLRPTGPLVRTDYGLPPSERPDWRNPAEQWDVKRPTPNLPITTSTLQPSMAAPTPLTPEEERLYSFSRLSPYSRDVVSAVSQPAPTGIAGGTMSGLPSVVPQFPSQQYREPMAPVTMGITGATERRGVQTAYGMVYPAAGQEAAAQRLAQLSPMSARLANVGQELNQQERLALVRRNAMLANQQRNQTMQNFAAERRQNQQLYATPSGSSIAAPTNMYGQPIRGIQQVYAQRQQGLRDNAATSAAMLAGTGFGAMRQTQQENLPLPIRSQSLYGGLGYASAFGGPQPATSLATGPAIRSRRRFLGTV